MVGTPHIWLSYNNVQGCHLRDLTLLDILIIERIDISLISMLLFSFKKKICFVPNRDHPAETSVIPS